MGRRRRMLGGSATAVIALAAGLAGCGSGPRRLVGAAVATTVAPGTASAGAGVAGVGPGAAGAAGAAAGGAGAGTTTTLASPAASDGRAPTTTARRPLSATAPPAPAATPPTAAVGTPPASCGATLAGRLAASGGGSQLITVVAATTASSFATVTLWQRSGGCWTQAGGPWPSRLGYNGLSTQHREGDGTTPSGLYAVSSAFYGLAPDPGVHGSYHRLVCGDWWDEDPASPAYNTFQHVACGATPSFAGGSEALWQQTTAYQHFALVDYNTGPVVAGAGSAIFIHDDTGVATNGCVSLPAADVTALVRWLQPGQSPHIAIGTTGTIGQY